MRIRRWAVGLGVLALAAALGNAGRAEAETKRSQSILGRAYLPKTMRVPLDTTVTWRNADRTQHSVTSVDGLFDSGRLAPRPVPAAGPPTGMPATVLGGAFSYSFTKPGKYAYYCTVRPGMIGTIVVGPVAATSTQPTPRAPTPTATRAPSSEATVAQRIDVESISGRLRVRAVNASRTSTASGSFISISVRMENAGQSELRIDPRRARLADDVGRSHAPVPEKSSFKPGMLAAGETAEGTIAFDVPGRAGRFVLGYAAPGGRTARIPLPPAFDWR